MTEWARVEKFTTREETDQMTDLERAKTGDKDLRGVDLSRANLYGVGGVIDGGYPNKFKAYAYWDKDVLYVRVGCHTKILMDARTYWYGKLNRREVMAFLDYAEAVAKVRQP